MTAEQTQAGLEVCPDHDNFPLRNGECSRCGWKPTEDQKVIGMRHIKEQRAKWKLKQRNPYPGERGQKPVGDPPPPRNRTAPPDPPPQSGSVAKAPKRSQQ